MEIRISERFRQLIPPLTSEEYQQLEQNILQDGCRDPLVVWGEILIDGHNRYEICQKHHLPHSTKTLSFESEDDAAIWIIRNQFGRRNLAPFTRGELALQLEPLLRAKAKENQRKGGEVKQKSAEAPVETRKELAKIAGLSHDTIAKIKLVAKHADEETKKDLRENKVSINEVAGDIRRAAKREEHAKKVAEAAAKPVELSGPFDLVLADPPWRYDFSETENREVENHYPTATVEDICGHAPDTTPDSVLLLWATAPKLKEALQVLSAWGFSYVTHAIWDKQKVGMGYWFRGQHELLLVGVKGKPGCTPECERVGSIFSEARGPHSKKPESVYAWIERAFPGLKKLEMYCRTPRAGWGRWGNEC